MGRVLGIDFGTKRMGFAISDPTRMLSSSHSVLEYTKPKQPLYEVKKLCAEQGVELIVIGWPINMNGSAGPITELVQAFIDKLRTVVDVPIEKWDERLTSKSAEDVLIEAGTSRKKRKKYIDKMAAQILLQSYLDAQGMDFY